MRRSSSVLEAPKLDRWGRQRVIEDSFCDRLNAEKCVFGLIKLATEFRKPNHVIKQYEIFREQVHNTAQQW